MRSNNYKVLLEKMLECINKMFKNKGLEHQNELCLASSKSGKICTIMTRKNYKLACTTLDAIEDNKLNDDFAYTVYARTLKYNSPKKTFETLLKDNNFLLVSLKDDDGERNSQSIRPSLLFGKTFEEVSIKIDLMLEDT